MRNKWTVLVRGAKRIEILDPAPLSDSCFHPLSEVCKWFSLVGRVACISEELLVAGFKRPIVVTYTVSRVLKEGEDDRPLPQDFIQEAKRVVRNLNLTNWAKGEGRYKGQPSRHFVLVLEPQGRPLRELVGESQHA